MQVQQMQSQWKSTEFLFLCSDHFTEDCFKVNSALASQFEMKKGRRLKPGAVPTIFHRPFTTQAETEERSSHKRTVAAPMVGDDGDSC